MGGIRKLKGKYVQDCTWECVSGSPPKCFYCKRESIGKGFPSDECSVLTKKLRYNIKRDKNYIKKLFSS